MPSPILIYGTWKVGQSLARFCEHIEQEYVICDDKNSPHDFGDFQFIIPSPGIPSTHPVYESGKVISELDFLARYIPKWFQVHAITGTDGKSTTSWILYHFLSRGLPDQSVYLGGNFGTPFADILLEINQKWQKDGHIVLEVSSFMAYSLQKFYANNSILTNLHPDHLDWHRDLSEYYNAKINLLAHTKEKIVYPGTILKLFPQLRDFPLESYVVPDEISLDHGLMELTPGSFIDLSDTQLFGTHNVANIYSAAILALHTWISVKSLSSILPLITALPHRLQLVSDVGEKKWIDDSKSTTAQSLYAALESFPGKKIHLIAGGKDKGDPFTDLAEHLKDTCAQCVAIGETKPVFLQACHDAFVPAVSVATLEEAVEYMHQNTNPGDIILLSPGCASFDMFENYEDRAAHYVRAIHALK